MTERLQAYRLLIVLFGLGTLVGLREFAISRRTGVPDGIYACEASAASCFSIRSSALATSDPGFWSRHARMLAVVEELNPDDPDTGFLKAMESLAAGRDDEFIQHVEQSIARGVKHNHFLLQYYAQYLLDQGADWRRVNEAVNRWRKNHPSSGEPLSLNLAAGPRSAADAQLLRAALSRIAWIEDARIEAPQDTSRGWRVYLSFRPGQKVDLRQAVAAVTVLSIPSDQRHLFQVTCQTLEDCTATRVQEGR